MPKLDRVSSLVLLVLAGCGGTPATPAVDAATPIDASSVDAATDAGPGEWTETPYLTADAGDHTYDAADPVLEAGADYAARIVTDEGTIVIDLAEDEAPIAVNSFVFLARQHFFEGIAFHRVLEDFMAQTGDPNSIAGAPSTWGYGGCGYEFVNEESALRFDGPGVVALANAGPDTNGSQFFITFVATPHLDGGYTIFGHVTEGLDVLPSVARGEPPASPTRITSIQILQR